jgi:GR25 family glycosyltransferase involved in LPS biosynthesis
LREVQQTGRRSDTPIDRGDDSNSCSASEFVDGNEHNITVKTTTVMPRGYGRTFSDMQAHFEAIPYDASCAYCNGRSIVPALPEPVEAIYCISLQEEGDRTRRAIAHFHAIGLCRHVTFFRPQRGRNVEAATWASHRDVARHVLACGQNTVLVLEDDVQFSQPLEQFAPRVSRAMRKLPQEWWGFYLGHWPLQGYFIATDVMRVRSTCAHAYVANRPLLDWLARSKPLDATIPMLRLGAAVDTALANLSEMYALFPMVATQRLIGTRISPRFAPSGNRRRWFEFSRHRYWIIYYAMRPAEAMAAILSPMHWLSMRLRGIGCGQHGRIETTISRQARIIRDAALFDEAYYLANAADVAASGNDALGHYIGAGDREGRRPHPLFDVDYYRQAVGSSFGSKLNTVVHYLQSEPDARRDPHPLFDGEAYVRQNPAARSSNLAPLPHYLKFGAAAGYSPHPCFDAAWYLSEYPDVVGQQDGPLVHYLKLGWKQGRFPHPSFDTQRYLREYPDVAAAGVNPLEHYVRYGRSEGRAPWIIVNVGDDTF